MVPVWLWMHQVMYMYVLNHQRVAPNMHTALTYSVVIVYEVHCAKVVVATLTEGFLLLDACINIAFFALSCFIVILHFIVLLILNHVRSSIVDQIGAGLFL